MVETEEEEPSAKGDDNEDEDADLLEPVIKTRARPAVDIGRLSGLGASLPGAHSTQLPHVCSRKGRLHDSGGAGEYADLLEPVIKTRARPAVDIGRLSGLGASLPRAAVVCMLTCTPKRMTVRSFCSWQMAFSGRDLQPLVGRVQQPSRMPGPDTCTC